MNAVSEIVTQSAIALGPPVGVTVENVMKRFQDTPAARRLARCRRRRAARAPRSVRLGQDDLLRILAGLDAPTEGRVLFGGEDALGLDMRSGTSAWCSRTMRSSAT